MDTLIEQLNEKINVLSIDLDNMTRMNTTQRIVCKLIKICDGKSEFTLPMTKGRLALQVGIEQETLSRAIPKLRSYGVNIEDKRVAFVEQRLMRNGVCDTCAGRWTCKALTSLTAADR